MNGNYQEKDQCHRQREMNMIDYLKIIEKSYQSSELYMNLGACRVQFECLSLGLDQKLLGNC